jgi:hypothetical protein
MKTCTSLMRLPPRRGIGRRRRRGSALVWVTIMLTAMTAFCSLAVDLGRVQIVKTELRRAADAAAMYGAAGLAQSGPSAARANAADAADDNAADESPVVLQPADDVELGLWNAAAREFTVLTGANEANATAIRVTARRTKERQTAVPLMFARVIGVETCDVRAVAVAKINPRRPGVVGLDFISMSGNASGTGNVADSYNSKTGAAGTTGRAAIYSNGNISLSGSSRVYGDARPGVGKMVTMSGGAGVTGSVAPLTKPLDYPIESAGGYATANDNGTLPLPYYDAGRRDFTVGSATVPVPAGVYYLRDLTIGSSGTVNLSGSVTVYLTGDLKIDGTINTQASAPQNLRIVMVTAGTTATIASSSNTYADLYCPGSPLTMGGSGTLRGAVIARSITTGGTSRIIFDELYHVTAPGVSLVQ